MKNMKNFISLIALAIMVILPMNVHAALAFNIECDAMDQTTRTKTCYIVGSATGSSSISTFSGTLELTNLSIKSITANSPWTDSSSGTNLRFTSSTSVTSSSFTMATIVFDVSTNVTAESSCKAVLTPCADESGTVACYDKVEITPTYSCKVVNGTYYGKDGSVITEEEYNSACVSNPQTGNFLPYAVIIAGVSLAVIVFTVSRKNNKLYKI